MNKSSFLVFLLLLLVPCAGNAFDESVPIYFDQENWPVMYGHREKAHGLYPALIQEAFNRMGVSCRLLATSWKRARQRIDAGEGGLGGLYKTEEREKRYDFSAPIYRETLLLYVNRSSGFSFKTLDDLKGKTIGVVRGWSYGNAFDAARAAGLFRVEEAESDEINAQKLALRRVDAAVILALAGDMIVARFGLGGKIAPSPNPIAVNETFLAFNKTAQNETLLGRFNEVLASMKEDGTYAAIVAQASRL